VNEEKEIGRTYEISTEPIDKCNEVKGLGDLPKAQVEVKTERSFILGVWDGTCPDGTDDREGEEGSEELHGSIEGVRVFE
jgi:hypothetical protein